MRKFWALQWQILVLALRVQAVAPGICEHMVQHCAASATPLYSFSIVHPCPHGAPVPFMKAPAEHTAGGGGDAHTIVKVDASRPRPSVVAARGRIMAALVMAGRCRSVLVACSVRAVRVPPDQRRYV